MKQISLLIKAFAVLFFVAAILFSTGCSNSSNYSKEMQAKIDSMKIVLKSVNEGNITEKPGNL